MLVSHSSNRLSRTTTSTGASTRWTCCTTRLTRSLEDLSTVCASMLRCLHFACSSTFQCLFILSCTHVFLLSIVLISVSNFPVSRRQEGSSVSGSHNVHLHHTDGQVIPVSLSSGDQPVRAQEWQAKCGSSLHQRTAAGIPD